MVLRYCFGFESLLKHGTNTVLRDCSMMQHLLRIEVNWWHHVLRLQEQYVCGQVISRWSFLLFLFIAMCCELFIWRLMVWKCSILRFFGCKICKDIQCIVSVGYLCVTRWTCDKDLFSVTVFKCFLFGGLCLNVACSECLVALCLEDIFWSAC